MIESNIKIVIYGQVVGTGGSDDTTYAFTYPTPNAWLSDEPWLASLFDPRDARNFSESDIYAFWSNQEGNYYAIIFPSSDGRNGRLMLAVNVNGVSTDGAVVKKMLDELKGYYVRSRDSIESDTIEYYLKEFERALVPNDTFTNLSSGQKGYKVFDTIEDLTLFLTYPNQQEYEACRCVYFVPSKPLEADPNFTQLTTPIKVKYQIETPLPDGVTVFPTNTIFAGETLNIIYRKKYCTDVSKEAVIGKSSPYVTCFGNSVKIKSAEEAGIQFYKQVNLTFLEEGSRNEISLVEVKSDGRKLEAPFCFPENTPAVQITVQKDGFAKKNFTITQEDMNKGSVTIELTPQISKKDINVKWSDGRTSKIKIEFKESDKRLLNYLRDNSYTICIDDGKPKDKQLGYEQREVVDKPKRFWSNIPGWLWVLLVALIIVFLINIVLYWAPWEPGGGGHDTLDTSDTTYVQSGDYEAYSDSFSDDKAYLKREDKWTEDSLKTENCKKLVMHIKKGYYMDAIKWSDTLFEGIAPDSVNGYWNAIVESINKMPTSVSKEHIEDAFIRRSSNGEVDLIQLVVELKTLKEQASIGANAGTGAGTRAGAGVHNGTGSGDTPKKDEIGKRPSGQ